MLPQLRTERMLVTKEKFDLAKKIITATFRKEGVRLSDVNSAEWARMVRELCTTHSRDELRAIRKET
jgi:threonine synthase